ncbi:MAG: ribonuclease P protein component [bacterium]|nr:ribonuclease P protein component [bacterium]
MLPKKHHLLLRSEVDFFASSYRSVTTSFIVHTRKTSRATWQAAIIVPKKVAPKATDRNAFKRRVSELLPTVISTENTDEVVLVARKKALGMTRPELLLELHNVIRHTNY